MISFAVAAAPLRQEDPGWQAMSPAAAIVGSVETIVEDPVVTTSCGRLVVASRLE